ncbi:M48 family metallopeptidase [Ferrimonas kyonanensis]|uniref:M48 metallopeptidase family protein n=1 Tax=Ferrimonas kyonanensis TaxID=364763 RepID=UPI00040A0EC0|nr:YgjP-like metallopeptidase domain-containing protein [Ferrimonas kyonanensis]
MAVIERSLPYLNHYPAEIVQQVSRLLDQRQLGERLRRRYPSLHQVGNDGALREYLLQLKQQHMKKAGVVNKVQYDTRLHVIHNALGTHSYVQRRQGAKVKTHNEIRIAALFKRAPEPLLRMICVHELAHLKHKQHDKGFYQLCLHMLPDYHQLEFDTRLWLTEKEVHGDPFESSQRRE